MMIVVNEINQNNSIIPLSDESFKSLFFDNLNIISDLIMIIELIRYFFNKIAVIIQPWRY